MDKKTVVKLINNNIQEIEILITSISASYGIPEIEVNLLLSKLKVLKDEFEILSGINDVETFPSSIQTKEKKPEVKEEKSIVKEIIKEEESSLKKEEGGVELESEVETAPKRPERRKVQKSRLKERKEIKIVTTRADLEKLSPPNEIMEDVISEEKLPEKKSEKYISKKTRAKGNNSIMADKFVVTKQSINDLIASSHKPRDLATKLKDMPIENLKKAINLNDKIRFIKELFGGQNEKYKQAIDQLNNCKNLDEALKYLNKNYEWDQEKESFRDFLELIYRRFINS